MLSYMLHDKLNSTFVSGYEEKRANCSRKLPGDRDTKQVRVDKTKTVMLSASQPILPPYGSMLPSIINRISQGYN